MQRAGRNKLIVSGVVFAVVFCLTVRPVLNAADPSSTSSSTPASLADKLFRYASDLGRSLHERPLEERSADDYRRALDAYGQIVRLNTDNYYSAESLIRKAELLREMADATGDSALYQQAIVAYRSVVTEHPHSAFVGDALIGIAQIYEENLQDLDGSAAAYREMISHFPSSVLAREAGAVLTRFEAQLKNRTVDVTIASASSAEQLTRVPTLTNVRSFGGPDYARVVIDLSEPARFTERRAGNRLSIQLDSAVVSSSLYGRRFIVGEGRLLKRIAVSDASGASGTQIDVDVASLNDYSAFRLSEPERIVIDIHANGANGAFGAAGAAFRKTTPDGSFIAATHSEATGRTVAAATRPAPREEQRPARNFSADPNSLKSLPEITDPILPLAPANPASAVNSATQALAAKVDAKAAQSSIKRIVIDPGHGGHDTGTISASGMREKDLVLDVGRRLKAYIKHNYPDVEVIMTRDSDRFVALEERTAIANSQRADLFISIHANASPSRAASGVETFFLSPDRAPAEDLQAAARENARLASNKATDKPEPMFASVTVGNRVAESRELARYIQAGLVRGIGAESPRTAMNRGVKHAPFVVLLGAAMPSVLAEVSFLSNPKDDALLQTGQFRERVAASLFAGLNAYLKKSAASSRAEVKK